MFARSLFRTLAAASGVTFGGLLIFGDQLEKRYFPEPPLSFLANSAEEYYMNELRTGDLVLFRRNFVGFKPLRTIMCLLNYQLSKSTFDHVGVVIVDEEEMVPYVFEAGFRGVRLSAFDDRILSSRSRVIAIRKLNDFEPSSEQLLSFHELVQKRLAPDQAKQRDTLPNLLSLALFYPDRYLSLKTILALIQSINRRDAILESVGRLKKKRDLDIDFALKRKIGKQVDALEETLRGAEQSHDTFLKFIKKDSEKGRILFWKPKFHNSELVADAWKALGVLPHEVASDNFSVDNFVHMPTGVELLGHKASLGAPMYMRTSKSNFYSMQ